MNLLTIQTEGLSNDKKLLSPINPEPYGERFMKFIEGITKSPEEATREKTAAELEQQQADTLAADSAHNHNSSTGRRRSSSLGATLGTYNRSNTVNSTLQRNEHEAAKKGEKDVERERPDPRTLGAVRSPSADRSGGMQGQILPVVEEMGEASSNGGERSLRSVRSFQSQRNDGRPRTPAKDYVDRGRLSVESANGNGERRPRTPVKDWVVGGGAGGSGAGGGGFNGNGNVKRSQSVISGITRSSLDKDLPPLPPPSQSQSNGNGNGWKGKGKERV